MLRPLTEEDWSDLARLGGVPAVARMLTSVPAPWEEAAVKRWIAGAAWRGVPGFRLGVCLADGTLIGAVGLGGTPVSAAYFLGQAHWHQGYATEAMRGFLAACFGWFDLGEIEAEAFDDNPASHRVLQKLGFVRFGAGMGGSAARLEPAPITVYRLTLASFKAASG